MTERDEGPGKDKEDEERERREKRREREDRGEEAALRARLDKLSSALDAQDASAQRPEQDDVASSASLGKAMSLGFRVLTEFVAAVVVGALIGWQLDAWIGSSPAFLLVFLLFGTAAGFWNVYRIAVKPPGSKGGLI